MKTIKINSWSEVPKNFTGIIEYPKVGKHCKRWFKNGKAHREDGPAIEWADGEKEWYKDGERHREDGPACEYSSGEKEWWIENIYYVPIDLKDYIILDHYQGRYNLIWYKLLDKNRVFEYPDIPGLIEK